MTPLAPPARVRTQLPPVDHALKAAMLQADRGLRLAQASYGAMRLLAEPGGGSSWNDLWAIGNAALGRWADLQNGWAADWLEWMRYAAQVDGATSLAKLNERECNIAIQAVQLVSEQSAALLNLFENVEVDVLYWISERSAAPTSAPQASSSMSQYR